MVIQATSIKGSAKGLRYQADDKGLSLEIARNGLIGDEPGDWHKQMQEVESNNIRAVNKRFSVVLAPSKEVSANLKINDWNDILDKYLDKMGIDKTNHQYIAHLHTSTDDTHLHLTVSRIPMKSPDLKYTAINDNHIGVKSGTVADQIAKSNGWRTSKEIGTSKRTETADALRSVLKTARTYPELSNQMLKLGYIVRLSENEAKGIYGMRIISQADANSNPSKNAINNSLGYKLSELMRTPDRKATFRINDINIALNRNTYNSLSRSEQISFLNDKHEKIFNVTKTEENVDASKSKSTTSILDELLKPTLTTKADDDLLKKKRRKRK